MGPGEGDKWKERAEKYSVSLRKNKRDEEIRERREIIRKGIVERKVGEENGNQDLLNYQIVEIA
jgi:hypothetical protein